MKFIEKLNAKYRLPLAIAVYGQHSALVQYLVNRYAGRARRVLDLGARRSPYTVSLKGLVFAIDLPPRSDADLGLKVDMQSTRRHNLVPVYGSGEHLPFKNDVFDAVLMIEVIEHIPRDDLCIAEVSRVLKPGGVLVLSTPNAEALPIPSKHHLRHYSDSQLVGLLPECLRVEKLWCVFPKGRLWRESVRGVRQMLEERRLFSVMRHLLCVWVYWLVVALDALLGKGRNATTIFLVARKQGSQSFRQGGDPP
jgi:ubiquinone/menaquinone biosynthesis C-methylase UbiE